MKFSILIFISAVLASTPELLFKRATSCDIQPCVDASNIISDKCDDSGNEVLSCICQLDDDYWNKVSDCAKGCDSQNNNYSPDQLKQLYCQAAQYASEHPDAFPTEAPSAQSFSNLADFSFDSTNTEDASSAIQAIINTLSALSQSEAKASSTGGSSSSGSSRSSGGAGAVASSTTEGSSSSATAQSSGSSSTRSGSSSSSSSGSSSQASSSSSASSSQGSNAAAAATIGGGSLISLILLSLL
ncbi:uncharacterized protein KGF55_000107 [Candida pseudojiufengensis]|uniref:uncharacterized protein n=1 Tax=Candida pseudojiufengensis TaxID=497109 RepID=UPI0022246DD7|nr:uncharacterized protein KGF55_000107 [Candida pseudojiufengensis]KAI5966698.1 hypothetical protein KGF55_000107 [Candida pseudojiufengensis]